MKRLLLFLIFLLLIVSVSADGMIHIRDNDMWSLYGEDKQLCAINYKDGIQHMLLAVAVDPDVNGSQAVWLFPIPASPEQTNIDILKGFPNLNGQDVEERAEETIEETFMVMRGSQIYFLPVLFSATKRGLGYLSQGFGNGLGNLEGVSVYESIESGGLTTELISARDTGSLALYLSDKGLELTGAARTILDEYIGQDYSFVVSWISDISEFKLSQKETREYRWYGWTSKSIGVYVDFPTDKMYFPLKPTSVYNDFNVPAVVYVLDFVTPELYDSIEEDTEVNYFLQNRLSFSDELLPFFAGQNIDGPDVRSQTNFINDVQYTKIKIDTPSYNLKDDLWLTLGAPSKIKTDLVLSKMRDSSKTVWMFIFFFIISILSSFISGSIIFKKTVSKGKLLLTGLLNLFSLPIFIGLAYLIFSSKRIPENIMENKRFSKFVLWRIALFTFTIPIVLVILVYIMRLGYELNLLIALFFVSVIFCGIIFTPFVWGYYRNRKTMKYGICFSIIFLILTYLFQWLFLTIF